MSKRRERGDWVWLLPNSGFYTNSHLQKVQLYSQRDYCLLSCGDLDCREWDVAAYPTEPGECALLLWHVSECQMLDEQWKEREKEDENEGSGN